VGTEALENLKADWIHVKSMLALSTLWTAIHLLGVKSWADIDPNTSSINIDEFRQLMNNAISEKELNALFGLYDYNHDGTITWKEYICVIALIMAGSVQEKIRRMLLSDSISSYCIIYLFSICSFFSFVLSV
jgi:hypothetical protein